jgi:hypothetical protein
MFLYYLMQRNRAMAVRWQAIPAGFYSSKGRCGGEEAGDFPTLWQSKIEQQ